MILMDLFYSIAVLSTGLFSGLMMTLVFILQKQWMQMDRKDYYSYFRGFLLVAKGNGLITALTMVSFLIPIFIGIFMINNNLHLIGFLITLSGIIFFIGCFLVTIFLNLPIYARVVSWNNELEASDWEDVRRRFFLLNIIRFSASTLSFALLIFSKNFINAV